MSLPSSTVWLSQQITVNPNEPFLFDVHEAKQTKIMYVMMRMGAISNL